MDSIIDCPQCRNSHKTLKQYILIRTILFAICNFQRFTQTFCAFSHSVFSQPPIKSVSPDLISSGREIGETVQERRTNRFNLGFDKTAASIPDNPTSNVIYEAFLDSRLIQLMNKTIPQRRRTNIAIIPYYCRDSINHSSDSSLLYKSLRIQENQEKKPKRKLFCVKYGKFEEIWMYLYTFGKFINYYIYTVIDVKSFHNVIQAKMYDNGTDRVCE